MTLQDDMRELIGRPVVLDTLTTTVYLGTLQEVTENGFWLVDADVHDCRDGHARREVYIMECCRDGVSANRKRVFVLRTTVCSISPLDEVLTE